MTEESTAKVEVVLGIDLGTTNSLVAVMEDGLPRILPGEEGEARLPSVLALQGEELLVGFAAREKALDQPETTVWSIKRLMGRAHADFEPGQLASLPYAVVASERGQAQVELEGRRWSPEELSAHVLRALVDRAERHLGHRPTKAVITVPAYFDDAQRQATRTAGAAAGLEVLRIVNEPTAAALAYGLDRRRSGRVVVYDLGGGTFDVSVLEIQEGLFRVRSTSGDTHLGGDDFDQVLGRSLLEALGPDESPDPRLLQAVKKASEAAKIQLGEHSEVAFSVEDRRSGRTLEATVRREDFEASIDPLIERTLECCRRALRDAEARPDELDAVVLVGGSTRVPRVRQKVAEFFGRQPYTGVDPDQVVAIGAAVQADILGGGSRETLLLDVLPLSLGIETYGGATAKVLMRNSPIPAQAHDRFTTSVDKQTAIDLHVVQGERELAQDCRSLGRFRLRVPPLPAGMVRVQVRFLVDENGVLQVHATEEVSGEEAGIEVVPSYGLTDEEIARIVTDSAVHAREDMLAHQRIDLIQACTTMIQSVDKILAQGRHGLSDADLDAIQAERSAVQEALRDPSDVKALKKLYDRFTEVTVPLAGQVMSEVALEVVQGKTVDEVLGESKSPEPPAGAAAPPAEREPSRVGAVLQSLEGGVEKDCGDLGDGFRASVGRQGGGATVKLNWRSAEDIGIALFEQRPETDPLTVRFTDLRQWVMDLEDFEDDPGGSSEGILEAIQMAWYEEWQDR